MSYSDFIDGLINNKINAVTNGYQLRKLLGFSQTALNGWQKSDFPHSRNEDGHLVIPVGKAVRWFVENGKTDLAGKLHDHYTKDN